MSMEHIKGRERQENSEEAPFSLDRVLLARAIEQKRQAVREVEDLIAAREEKLSEYLKSGSVEPIRIEKFKEGIQVLERTRKIRESERLTLLKELYGDEKPSMIH